MQTRPPNKLTLESARKLFQQCANHPELTWDHNNTGCESRADLMAEIAVEHGLTPSKIWIEICPGSEDVFGIYLNSARTEVEFCKYHVAVVLDTWIIDPGFFNEPVSCDDWIKRLSIYCGERSYQCKVSESDWRNFYGPEQMIFNREQAVEDRTKLLALARDLDDATVFHGVMAKARGEWADSLRVDDPEGFEKIVGSGNSSAFGLWLHAPERGDLLEQWLRENPYYFGLPSEQVLGAVEFTDRLAALEVRKTCWRYIHELYSLLTKKREEFLNHVGSGDSPESKLAFRFRLFWGDSAEDRAQASAEWYGAASHKLWDQYGIDYRLLALKVEMRP